MSRERDIQLNATFKNIFLILHSKIQNTHQAVPEFQ